MEKHYQEQLPVGDVTKQSRYQRKVSDFITATFNKAKGQMLKKAEQSIQIHAIHSVPLTYITSELYYEERKIYESCSPSSYIRTTATKRQRASDYNMWEVDCPTPKNLFAQAKNTVSIAQSMFLDDCTTCFSAGRVACTCGNGTEICPSCYGNGGHNCNNCGGKGEILCPTCYGYGYVTRNEVVGYDRDNRPIWGDQRYTCNHCGGSRYVYCGNCGGSGYLTCNTCGGGRSITCRRCGGSQQVSCTSCNGLGHFLNSIKVDQSFDTTTSYSVIHSHPINASIYNGKGFAPFAKNEKDYLICEYISNSPMDTLPTESVLSNLFSKPYSVASYLREQASSITKHGDKRQIRKYRIRIYQREILDTEYEFQGSRYHFLYNVSTDEVLMDKNPYESTAALLLETLRGHADAKRFKSFLADYEEFISITGFDNITYSEEDIRPYHRRLSLLCGLIGTGAGLLLQIILCVFDSFSVIPLVLSLAASYATSRLWKRLASDNPALTYGLLSALSCGVVLLINLLLHQFL